MQMQENTRTIFLPFAMLLMSSLTLCPILHSYQKRNLNFGLKLDPEEKPEFN